MKKLPLLICVQLLWTSAVAQTVSFFSDPVAIHFHRTNLTVRWKAEKHPWPKVVGAYRVLPTGFSPAIISNAVALSPFTDTDRTDYGTNGVDFGHPFTTPYLRISTGTGEIDYDRGGPHYSPTRLAVDVPGTNQLFQLTTELLPKLGISLSEVSKAENGKPNMKFFEHGMYFYPNHTNAADFVVITNIASRGVGLRRALGGIEFVYTGGHCAVDFGEHSEIVKLQLAWPPLECGKLYAAASPKTIIRWIREGRAVQKRMMTDHGGETAIDWQTVKSLTITNAVAYYWAEPSPNREPPNHPASPVWVVPYADLSGAVDTGKTMLHVEIVCPIIDDTKPLNGRDKR